MRGEGKRRNERRMRTTNIAEENEGKVEEERRKVKGKWGR